MVNPYRLNIVIVLIAVLIMLLPLLMVYKEITNILVKFLKCLKTNTKRLYELWSRKSVMDMYLEFQILHKLKI